MRLRSQKEQLTINSNAQDANQIFHWQIEIVVDVIFQTNTLKKFKMIQDKKSGHVMYVKQLIGCQILNADLVMLRMS